MTSDHLDKWLSTCLVQTDAHWSSTPGSANFYPHCDQAPSQMPCFYPHSPYISRSGPSTKNLDFYPFFLRHFPQIGQILSAQGGGIWQDIRGSSANATQNKELNKAALSKLLPARCQRGGSAVKVPVRSRVSWQVDRYLLHGRMNRRSPAFTPSIRPFCNCYTWFHHI